MSGVGKLPNYAPERVIKMYRDAAVTKNVHFAIDYQFVANPEYNADGDPVNVLSTRFHVQF